MDTEQLLLDYTPLLFSECLKTSFRVWRTENLVCDCTREHCALFLIGVLLCFFKMSTYLLKEYHLHKTNSFSK